MRAQLKAWLTQTASYATESSISAYGDKSYGTPTTFSCRIEYVRWRHGPNFLPRHGEADESLTLVFTEEAIPLDALIWLPGENTSNTHEAHHVNKRDVIYTREGDVSHYEVWID